jgi:YVTN family beta-propeller protein
MNDEPSTALGTPAGRVPRNYRSWRVVVPVLVASGVAVGGFVVARGGEDPEPQGASLRIGGGEAAHRGMVAGTVWVANEDGASLSAIDTASNTVATTVGGVEGPHNVQVSPNGKSVWAVSGHDSLAVMFDASSLQLHGVAATGGAPAHVVLTPDGRTTYTTNGADNTVTAIDSATMTSVAEIPVGAGPHGLRPSPDGQLVVVANVGGSTLTFIDTASNTKLEDVEVGMGPAQVAFSPDGRFVYASVSGEDAVVKVDVATRKVLGRVAVGDGPIQTFVTPDDRYLLVANQGREDRPGTTVSVIDTKTFTVARKVETGQGAHGIVVDPSSRHAYVTNLYGDDVAVIDLEELRVVARIPVGDKPNGISFSSVTVPAQKAVMLDVPAPDVGAEPNEDMAH